MNFMSPVNLVIMEPLASMAMSNRMNLVINAVEGSLLLHSERHRKMPFFICILNLRQELLSNKGAI